VGGEGGNREETIAMPRQITDEEWNYLQGRKQVADFVESIYNDPSLSNDAKALIKRKYPNLNIPDYDIETRVNARFDQEKQERETREREAREADEDRQAKAARAKTQKDFGFTDDAMTRLEQMMVDRNIGDYEAAATLMASREPKPSSSEGGDFDSTRWNHDRQEGFADIAKDPEGWGRTQIMNAIRTDTERARQGR
jgi:hypothetical protein